MKTPRLIPLRAAMLLLALCGGFALVACGGGGGSGNTAQAPTPSEPSSPSPAPSPGPAFNGNLLLGAPTANAIALSLLSADQPGSVTIAYGTAPGTYDRKTATAKLNAGEPLAFTLGGLAADTAYYYRVEFQAQGASAAALSTEYRFHTARPSGAAFTFTIQADSHLDENSDLALYRRTLANVAADAADFHIDMGDTFMTEKHAEPLSAVVRTAPDAATVNARYAYERANFGIATHSVPLFLVNGNHDGELGWITDGSAQNLAVWATAARKRYFLNPLPGPFYSGDSFAAPFVGERAAWYAWHWGDALFIVLDPYWNSAHQASRDGWNITLGEAQYRWLASTLAGSTSLYKFVFVHNLVGGLDGQMRGGIEAAPFYEWGGQNTDGSAGFAARRPGWALPIHALLVKHGVTAVFHGHDHLYAKQDLDGIVYQEVPQPSAVNSSSGPTLARDYHYLSGTILSSSGHLRVRVAPTGVNVQYVRAWLPASETTDRRNAQVDASWAVTPRK
ncbi:MAG TPA: metallophosphoesterase family protein [Rubrivivax sp.]|nr:metallophosphoesterase family protein [Rubrivivax sp.]